MAKDLPYSVMWILRTDVVLFSLIKTINTSVAMKVIMTATVILPNIVVARERAMDASTRTIFW